MANISGCSVDLFENLNGSCGKIDIIYDKQRKKTIKYIASLLN